MSTIPSGKHRGKQLSELTDISLLAMQGSWIESRKLSRSPFLKEIQSEVAKRGFQVHDARPQKPKRSNQRRRRPKRGARAYGSGNVGYRVPIAVMREWLEYRGKSVPINKKDIMRFVLFELDVFRSGVPVAKQISDLFESKEVPPMVTEFIRFVSERTEYVPEGSLPLTNEYIELMNKIL